MAGSSSTVGTIRIGTRSSRLARWQSDWVADRLCELHPGLVVELVEIKTQGDRDRNSPLAAIGGIGLFTKEIQRAVADGSVDLAVHSLKDLPTQGPADLMLGAVPGARGCGRRPDRAGASNDRGPPTRRPGRHQLAAAPGTVAFYAAGPGDHRGPGQRGDTARTSTGGPARRRGAGLCRATTSGAGASRNPASGAAGVFARGRAGGAGHRVPAGCAGCSCPARSSLTIRPLIAPFVRSARPWPRWKEAAPSPWRPGLEISIKIPPWLMIPPARRWRLTRSYSIRTAEPPWRFRLPAPVMILTPWAVVPPKPCSTREPRRSWRGIPHRDRGPSG